MNTLTIRASTPTQAIEKEIPFIDMRDHAIERRDDAAAVLDEQGDQTVLELHQIDGATVLYSPVFGYAYVNQESAGTAESLLIQSGVDSPEHASSLWHEKLARMFKPETFILIAADSVQKLRGNDVYRLLLEVPPEFERDLVEYLVRERPDLDGDVQDWMVEINDERRADQAREGQ